MTTPARRRASRRHSLVCALHHDISDPHDDTIDEDEVLANPNPNHVSDEDLTPRRKASSDSAADATRRWTRVRTVVRTVGVFKNTNAASRRKLILPSLIVIASGCAAVVPTELIVKRDPHGMQLVTLANYLYTIGSAFAAAGPSLITRRRIPLAYHVALVVAAYGYNELQVWSLRRRRLVVVVVVSSSSSSSSRHRRRRRWFVVACRLFLFSLVLSLSPSSSRVRSRSDRRHRRRWRNTRGALHPSSPRHFRAQNRAFERGLPMHLVLVIKNGGLLCQMLVGAAVLGERYSARQAAAALAVTVGILATVGAAATAKTAAAPPEPGDDETAAAALLLVGAMMARALGNAVTQIGEDGAPYRGSLFLSFCLSYFVVLSF